MIEQLQTGPNLNNNVPTEELGELLNFVCMNCEGHNLHMETNIPIKAYNRNLSKNKDLLVAGVRCHDCGEIYMDSYSATHYAMALVELNQGE